MPHWLGQCFGVPPIPRRHLPRWLQRCVNTSALDPERARYSSPVIHAVRIMNVLLGPRVFCVTVLLALIPNGEASLLRAALSVAVALERTRCISLHCAETFGNMSGEGVAPTCCAATYHGRLCRLRYATGHPHSILKNFEQRKTCRRCPACTWRSGCFSCVVVGLDDAAFPHVRHLRRLRSVMSHVFSGLDWS